MKVLFLFGPNLGALGRRDTSIYGSESLGDIMRSVEDRATSLGHDLSWRQSDHEGDLVGSLLAAAGDGIEACGLPVVEVHMSNIYAREDFRQRSVVSGVCRASIIGLGAGGYHLALEAMP